MQASFTPTPPLRCLCNFGRGVFPQAPAHPPNARPPFHPQGGTAHHAPLLSSLTAQTHARKTRSCVPHSRGHRPLLWLSHASHRTLADSLLSAFVGWLLSSRAGRAWHHAPMCCGSRPRNHTVAFRVKLSRRQNPRNFRCVMVSAFIATRGKVRLKSFLNVQPCRGCIQPI